MLLSKVNYLQTTLEENIQSVILFPRFYTEACPTKLKVMSATIQLWDPQDRKYEEQNLKKISNR